MNRLAGETSPYLRQHRDNPVDWYPWGSDAFAAAAARDTPILLSVGYSSCHWCHVMAHESFEDPDVAAAMNGAFVCVKVDREERPDVDAIYMDAVQAMTGSGGWPMTVFLTPAGEPFYGGTYFPKDTFLRLLAAIDDAWRTRRGELQGNIDGLRAALDHSATFEPGPELPSAALISAAASALATTFDATWGGFGQAPKFPSAMNLELLLRIAVHERSEPATQIVTTTLDAMAAGGIYDHLGGGFARYSVDQRWLVPHFEKMLYDQALLARVYLHGWQAFGVERWRQVATETIDYVLRDLSQPEGGFSCAQDADSPGEDGHSHEGRFYVWTPAEIVGELGAELGRVAIEWWGVTEEGNFEGRNILNRLAHRTELARPPSVDAARAALVAARRRRPHPGLDDKVLGEWNGLFLATLAQASVALDRPDWLAAAITNAEFLVGSLRDPGGHWHRSWQRDGGARHDALAADHGALLDAFTRLSEATGQARWLDVAREQADTLLDRFWDAERGGVFTVAEDGEELIVRQKELFDSATPSANSLAAGGLARLAALTGEQRYANQADQILQLAAPLVAKAPGAFGYLLVAADRRRRGITEVVVPGDRPDLVGVAQRRYLPDAVLAWGERYDSPLWAQRTDGHAYVCRNYACRLPVDTPEALIAELAPA